MSLRRRFATILAVGAILAAGTMSTASAKPSGSPVVRDLATFAAPGCTGVCGSGSTIGPDGALYVTEPRAGRVRRVDPNSGEVTTFAQGLPQSIEAVGGGGAVDVAFLGRTAYVIVTGVEEALGGQPGAVDGLYRVNPDGSTSVIADIGAWSIAHPPQTHFDLNTGFLYAMQPYHDGFLVTDGHHNRVLRVRLNGEISEVLTLGNVVPTGLERSGHKVYFAEAGPVPHVPETGKALALNVRTHQATQLASGARLAVDVELGPKHTLYVLSQGVWEWEDIPSNAGLPASPNTGKLFRVDRHGNVIAVVEGLDRPTSVEFIKDTAFVVTLTGKVIRVDNVSRH
jgi:sugar lactone lactonase YvrE